VAGNAEELAALPGEPAKITLEDIAHRLSNVGRFAGQGREFLSVARHSVHFSLEAEVRGGRPATLRYALVHDAAEAYLSDVPGPVKGSLPGYKHAERRVDAAVSNAFGLDPSPEAQHAVEKADAVVGAHELSIHFPDRHEPPDGLQSEPPNIEEDAKVAFLERAAELGLD
jgi:hypothetical protein